MFYVYILLSSTLGKHYIGSTGNIDDRILRHNGGRSKATKPGVPWKLVWTESFKTRSEAVKRELELKSWKSHIRIEKMIFDSKQ